MKKALLMVLDGWGIGQIPEADAILQANTPCIDRLIRENPWSRLITHGRSVGLPDGQFGNSEVGHIHLGAGRVVFQELGRIMNAIDDRSISLNQVLRDIVQYCTGQKKPLHLIGLLSDGGVHSHIHHLKGLIEVFENFGLNKIYIHAIMDGRDTDPNSGLVHLNHLKEFLTAKKARLISVVGRYYAMDRDKRWERTSKAYDLYVNHQGEVFDDLIEGVELSYKKGKTDEFIEPILDSFSKKNDIKIENDDAVLFFNFRTDRLRQLVSAMTQRPIEGTTMKPLNLFCATMTRYDSSFSNVKVLFEKEDIRETLGEMISRFGGTQLRIAETEKYPHVSFFFSGGRETPFSGEHRILIPSPKVPTYDLKPEMSAIEVTNKLIDYIQTNHPDFICLNFANADMVGHTGVFNAVKRAAEAVDQCLDHLIPIAIGAGYNILILADHGNGDLMINPDGSPHTAHTMNDVPCILISSDKTYTISNGSLMDVAPTILDLMNLPQPEQMTGRSLLRVNPGE